MKIKKVFFDMDGVLCNYDKRYKELYGELNSSERQFKETWPEFVLSKQFLSFEWMPGGQALLNFVEQYPVKIEILSSTGGINFYDEIREQKEQWLIDNNINYRANIVPGKKYKSMFAVAENVLIDDTKSVIDDFNNAGGVGILHRNMEETLFFLKKILDKH